MDQRPRRTSSFVIVSLAPASSTARANSTAEVQIEGANRSSSASGTQGAMAGAEAVRPGTDGAGPRRAAGPWVGGGGQGGGEGGGGLFVWGKEEGVVVVMGPPRPADDRHARLGVVGEEAATGEQVHVADEGDDVLLVDESLARR